MSEYLEPDTDKQADSQSKKPSQSSDGSGDAKKQKSSKRKHFKVLHEDGSLADLPYNNEPGGGALEGTVGIGT
jgi:hypothetical protein